MQNNHDRRSHVNIVSAQSKNTDRVARRWLPLRTNVPGRAGEFVDVAVDLRGIGETAMKAAVKRLEERLDANQCPHRHTSCQNAIARALGFADGMSGFGAAWKKGGALERIFAERGVDPEASADLFAPHASDMDRFAVVSHRQLADRLFFSDKEWPKRIYTGYGKIDDADAARGEYRDWDWMARELLRDGFSWDGGTPAKEWEFRHELPGLLLSATGHLLGDNLLDFGRRAGPRNCFLWLHGETDGAREARERTLKLLHAVRNVLDRQEKGWIEIVRVNDSLALLFSDDGRYDFVFRGMREDDFLGVYWPCVKASEIAPGDAKALYPKWAYFEYRGWRERDLWDAEEMFGRGSGDYPGQEDLLRDYFLKRHVWTGTESGLDTCDKDELDRMGLPLEFRRCKEGSRCFFSNLVTVGLFREFLAANPVYAARRGEPAFDQFRWEQGKDDDPALVCWYDAYMFAAWFGRKHGLRTVLPPLELYVECFGAISPAPVLRVDEMLGKTFDEIRESSEHGRFEREDGLEFHKDLDFAEWLEEKGAAVNTLFLSAARSINATPERDRCAPESDCRHARMKIGFRLCCRGKIAK